MREPQSDSLQSILGKKNLARISPERNVFHLKGNFNTRSHHAAPKKSQASFQQYGFLRVYYPSAVSDLKEAA